MFTRAFPAVFALAALVQSALGNVYTTSPVVGTIWAAGQNQTISWQDNGNPPSLAEFGNSKVSVYVGNPQVQTLVQEIVDSVNVSSTASIVFTPDPAVGPNGEYYFIRFQSLDAKDANNSAYPAEAFSATFTLSGMTGSFNASVQAEIDGLVSSSSAFAASSTAAAPTAPAKSSTSGGSSVGAANAQKTLSSTSATASTTARVSAQSANGAAPGAVVGASSALAAVAAVALAFIAAAIV